MDLREYDRRERALWQAHLDRCRDMSEALSFAEYKRAQESLDRLFRARSEDAASRAQSDTQRAIRAMCEPEPQSFRPAHDCDDHDCIKRRVPSAECERPR